jgi:hypothetical protein
MAGSSNSSIIFDMKALRLTAADDQDAVWISIRHIAIEDLSDAKMQESSHLDSLGKVFVGVYGIKIGVPPSTARSSSVSGQTSSITFSSRTRTVQVSAFAAVSLGPTSRKAARAVVLAADGATQSVFYTGGTPAVAVLRLRLFNQAITGVAPVNDVADAGYLDLPEPHSAGSRARENWVNPVRPWVTATALQVSEDDAVLAVGFSSGEIILWCTITGVALQFVAQPSSEPRVECITLLRTNMKSLALTRRLINCASTAAHIDPTVTLQRNQLIIMAYYSNGNLVSWAAPLETPTRDEDLEALDEPVAFHRYEIGMREIGGLCASGDANDPVLVAYVDGSASLFNLSTIVNKI